MRMKIAVIGSGIAGLGAAYFLDRVHDVEVFERDTRTGGHAHTHAVRRDGADLALDTGFLVFNERTYPNFVKLLAELGVPSQPSDMSFSARCHRCRLEYSTRGLATLFAQPWRVADPRHLRMLADILRFFRHAERFLASDRGHEVTLGRFLEEGRYGRSFARHFLLPLTGAVWSASFDDMRAFPARTLLHFMRNHGMLTATDNPPWRTVTGGSRSYVRAIVGRLRGRVHTGLPAARLARHRDGVRVTLADGTTREFDRVVVATHADEALALLADPSVEETRALASFRYSRNRTVLHTDEAALPATPSARAAWNSEIEDCTDEAAPVSLTYSLNRLQSVPGPTQYCVSLNRARPIAGDVIATMDYAHPILDGAASTAQALVRALNGTRHTFYCGAHLRHGFHEDGLVSAMEVAAALGVTPWATVKTPQDARAWAGDLVSTPA
jgi:predicted NAD/FAD-binding protein